MLPAGFQRGVSRIALPCPLCSSVMVSCETHCLQGFPHLLKLVKRPRPRPPPPLAPQRGQDHYGLAGPNP